MGKLRPDRESKGRAWPTEHKARGRLGSQVQPGSKLAVLRHGLSRAGVEQNSGGQGVPGGVEEDPIQGLWGRTLWLYMSTQQEVPSKHMSLVREGKDDCCCLMSPQTGPWALGPAPRSSEHVRLRSSVEIPQAQERKGPRILKSQSKQRSGWWLHPPGPAGHRDSAFNWGHALRGHKWLLLPPKRSLSH